MALVCNAVHYSSFDVREDNTWTYQYELVQSILFCSAIVCGLFVVCHMLYSHCRRSSQCHRQPLMFIIVLTGFLHTLKIVCLLCNIHTLVGNRLYWREAEKCIDYTFLATLANGITFFAIGISIIQRNTVSLVKRCIASIVYTGSILTGLVLLLINTAGEVSFVTDEKPWKTVPIGFYQVEVYWTMCKTNVSSAKYELLCEICFIHLPFAIVVVTALGSRSFKRCVRILRAPESCDSSFCICSRFNEAMNAVACYSVVFLLLVRPAMIVYAYETSGDFRDVLPTVTFSVNFVFLCTEYLFWLKYKHSQYADKPKFVLRV